MMRSGKPSPVTSPIAVATGNEPPLWTDEARKRGSGAAARAGLATAVAPRTARQATIFTRIITARPRVGSSEDSGGCGEGHRPEGRATFGIGRMRQNLGYVCPYPWTP